MQASASIERLSRNQLLFREVNERIREVAGRFGVLDAALFICECGRADCADAVELDLRVYDELRSRPDSFVILPGHESAGEQVVARNKRYLIVRAASGQQAPFHDRNV